MIILDTNILSALMQKNPDAAVISWLDRVPTESVWITSVTLFEVRYGLALLPEGKRRKTLIEIFDQIVADDLDGRVLLFDQAAAEEAAQLAAARRKNGYTVDMRDTFIAGIALAKKATIATRNTKHFSDLQVDVINPWEHI
ncbi:MAG: PIN domain-containing protein [Desulfuromusa sp.]|nr:PIN domain-containing protein [Desulfuromusa sp.]